MSDKGKSKDPQWHNNEVNVGFQASFVIRQPKPANEPLKIVDMSKPAMVSTSTGSISGTPSGNADDLNTDKKSRKKCSSKDKKEKRKKDKKVSSKKSSKDKKKKHSKKDSKMDKKRDKKDKVDTKSGDKRGRDEKPPKEESMTEKRAKNFNPLLQWFATSISDSTRIFEA